MKKFLMVVCLVAASATLVQAQGGGQGGGARMGEMMKQRLKEELKFSDQKIDSIMAVQTEFQQKKPPVAY